MLCLAFGPDGITYTGTLSGDIYKWNKNNLSGTVHGSHEVTIHDSLNSNFECCAYKLWEVYQNQLL